MNNTEDFRKKLLIELYNQLWNSINTRLDLIWQSIGVLISAFAIFALTERNVISLDIASAIIILIAIWFLAHVIDMSFWHNRNLAIITNIERQFLTEEDARLLFPYFLSHRKSNRTMFYMRNQAGLGIGIALLILIFHFNQNVLPILQKKALFTIETIFPYAALVFAIVFLQWLKTSRDKEYAEFIKISPGKIMATEETQLGRWQHRR